jgi:hypothetical protein
MVLRHMYKDWPTYCSSGSHSQLNKFFPLFASVIRLIVLPLCLLSASAFHLSCFIQIIGFLLFSGGGGGNAYQRGEITRQKSHTFGSV